MDSIHRIITTVRLISKDLEQLKNDYCIIGSAALCLNGMNVGVNDLDILTSAEGARSLAERWMHIRDRDYIPQEPERFRSVFGRYQFTGLPVEVMGDLEVNTSDGWERIVAEKIMVLSTNGVTIRIPDLSDQKRILRLLGRPKDIAKIKIIESFKE